MRDLLDKLTVVEAADDLDQLKTVISAKIKNLPDDDATVKALQEIEDLLKHVNAGGKMGIINGELQKIDDPLVQKAQKDLARYIMSIDMTPAQRDELFDLWRNDKLVDRKALLEPGVKKNITDIINKYEDNPVIKDLVDDLMRIAALGQGKGEFALGVLSKSINFPPKGDLLIDGRKIEVKTTDGGAGRFKDQDVGVGEGFEAAARNLNDKLVSLGINVPKSGANLKLVISAYQDTKDDELLDLIEKTISIIFEGEDIKPIVGAIEKGNFGAAMQEYAKTSFEYYINKKDDEGVLYIALDKDPVMTVYFEDADDLDKSQMRLHAGTVYITSIADDRLPYPQMRIVGTSQAVGSAETGVSGVTVADPVDVAAQAEKVSDAKSAVKAAPKREPISTDTAVLGRKKK